MPKLFLKCLVKLMVMFIHSPHYSVNRQEVPGGQRPQGPYLYLCFNEPSQPQSKAGCELRPSEVFCAEAKKNTCFRCSENVLFFAGTVGKGTVLMAVRFNYSL